MKKASKLLWVLLPLLIMALAMAMTSCGGDDGGEEGDPVPGTANNPTTISADEWGIYYFKLVDKTRRASHRDMSGLERFHFHFNFVDLEDVQGIEIQKIFVSTTNPKDTIPANAQMIADYTLAEPEVGSLDDTTWTGFTEIDIGTEAGKLSTGAVSGESNGSLYKYLGNIGSALLPDAVYVGFVMKNVSEEATAEAVNLTFDGDDLPVSATNPISITALFGLEYEMVVTEPPPQVFVEDWTEYYVEIPEDSEIIDFHVNTGYVEIQDIFVSNIPSKTSAKVLIDFTSATPYDSEDFWWGADSIDAFISGNVYVLDSNEQYKAGARFASASIVDNKYIGFTIKSPEAASEVGLGDTRIRLGHDDYVEDVTVNFSDMVPKTDTSDLDLSQWTVAYYPIPASADGAYHFHGGAWNMGGSYIEIQKISFNATKATAGATVLFDFTADPSSNPDGDNGPLYWEELSGRVNDGAYVYSNADGDYAYGGGFGASASGFLVFVFKTNTGYFKTGLADFRVAPGDVLFKSLDFAALP